MNDKSNNIGKMLVLIATLTGIVFIQLAMAAEPPARASAAAAFSGEIARVGAVQGDAKVQRSGEAQFKKIEKNAPLFVMDYLSTSRGAKIWWKGSPGEAWSPFPETTHGSLGENTVFGFESMDRAGPTVRFVGNVPKGIVRFIKKVHRTDPPSSFAIGTPTAWIQVEPGDRAADFPVEYVDPPRTTVTVFWGRVKVKNISKDLVSERVLTSCQEVDVEKDKEPGEIRYVSTDTMKNLIKRTTIPNTLPTDVPSCERIKSEVSERPGKVHVPPAGVAVIPIPIPVPVTVSKEDCPCPCPPGQQYNPNTRECVPCRPSSVPLTAQSPDSQQCGCSCPCPTGQVLLPGRGCVPQCPEGFTLTYDTSESAPYRCPVCVQRPVALSTGCGPDRPCGPCQTCEGGQCIRRTCPDGEVLNMANCSCGPIRFPLTPPCSTDSDCAGCSSCRDGRCVATVTCGSLERLNPQTCTCERINVTVVPLSRTTVSQCTDNTQCGSGEVCRNGRCVRRPPRENNESALDLTTFPEEPAGQAEEPRRPRFEMPGGISIGIGVGIGGGGGGGGGGSRGGGRTGGKPN